MSRASPDECRDPEAPNPDVEQRDLDKRGTRMAATSIMQALAIAAATVVVELTGATFAEAGTTEWLAPVEANDKAGQLHRRGRRVTGIECRGNGKSGTRAVDVLSVRIAHEDTPKPTNILKFDAGPSKDVGPIVAGYRNSGYDKVVSSKVAVNGMSFTCAIAQSYH